MSIYALLIQGPPSGCFARAPLYPSISGTWGPELFTHHHSLFTGIVEHGSMVSSTLHTSLYTLHWVAKLRPFDLWNMGTRTFHSSPFTIHWYSGAKERGDQNSSLITIHYSLRSSASQSNQYSFAPAGMWLSTISRWSFSSSPSL